MGKFLEELGFLGFAVKSELCFGKFESTSFEFGLEI